MANAPTNAQTPPEGFFHKPSKFLHETWVELKKTHWPSKDELQKSTISVLLAVLIVGVWIAGLDFLLTKFTQAIGW